MSCVLQSSHNQLLYHVLITDLFWVILTYFTYTMAFTVYKLDYMEVELSKDICHISFQGDGRETFIQFILLRIFFMCSLGGKFICLPL